jgi:hypothetical protein
MLKFADLREDTKKMRRLNKFAASDVLLALGTPVQFHQTTKSPCSAEGSVTAWIQPHGALVRYRQKILHFVQNDI